MKAVGLYDGGEKAIRGELSFTFSGFDLEYRYSMHNKLLIH